MKHARTIRFVVVGLMLASALAAGSLERARSFYARGDLESARREAAEVVEAAAGGEEEAAALDLLGAIAVRRGEWARAREVLTRLADDHPATPLAEQARTKLALLAAIPEASGAPLSRDRAEDLDDPALAAPAPAAAAPVAAPDPAVGSGREPGAKPAAPALAAPSAAPAARPGAVADDRDDPAAAPVAAPASPAVPATAAPDAPAAASGRELPREAVQGPAAPPAAPAPGAPAAVLVAGDGKPREHFQDAAEMLMEFLAERGIAVREAPDGLAMLQDTRAALPRYLEAARAAGAASLLYFEAQFGHRERIEVECLAPDGTSLWREKVTGGLGLRDRKVNKRLMNRFLEKLGPRIGGPGLPAE